MRNRYTKDILEPIIKDSKTWADVCRKLGVKPMTGTQCHIKKRANDFKIEYSHFLGKSIIKGRTSSCKKNALKYISDGGKNSNKLRIKLIEDGLKQKRCEICKNDRWQDKDIPLELHHIDGNHFNNDLRNLQILCPNCHSQQ